MARTARTSRMFRLVALVAAIVLVLVLIPTSELGDEPPTSATNDEPPIVASTPIAPDLVTESQLASESVTPRAVATAAEPKLTLRVVAVDPRGRAVAAEQLVVREGSDQVGRVTRCEGEPCFVVEDLGAGAVELVLSIGGRRFTKMHDPQSGTAKIEVPDHGGLRVEFEPWLAPPAMYRMKIQDEQGLTILLQNVVPEARTEFVNVPVLFPGSYTVELTEIDAAGGEAKLVVAHAEHVVILANEWSMVRLVKP